MSKLTAPSQLKNLSPPRESQALQRNKKVYEASKLYEAQFLREMNKAMRKSVQESGLVKKNMGEKIFQEKLDHEYVDKWVNKGGVGLADVIYNHLMERYHGITVQRPVGPMSLKGKSIQLQSNPNSESIKVKGNFKNEEVKAPWSGEVKMVNPELGSVIIDHNNGLRSSLLLPKANFVIREGQSLSAGQRVALLDQEDWEIFMNFKNLTVNEGRETNTEG